MELSGEILAGCFFEGLPGPQFMSLPAFRRLTSGLPEKAVYWINALDPISPCGLKLDSAKQLWPKRLAATHLVFKGSKLVLASERQGRRLTIKTDPNDPDLPSFFGPLHHLLGRGFMPLGRLKIESINGEPAATSPYLEAFRTVFDALPDYEAVILYRALETR
jgi:ATP-dependent Lhr-like helicase